MKRLFVLIMAMLVAYHGTQALVAYFSAMKVKQLIEFHINQDLPQ